MGYIIRDGVIYGGGSGGGDNIFHGTQDEWEQLSSAQKASYDFAAFTDDYDPSSITNPNLLDNPWFTVNQRGQNQYVVNGKYSVDRWRINNGESTVDVTDNGVTVTKTGSDTSTGLVQYIEPSRIVDNIGKTITLSIRFSDNTVKSYSAVIPTLTSTNNFIIQSNIDGTTWTAALCVRTPSNCFVMISTLTNDSPISIRAVKLELGSVSTLAMDTIPNYQQELAKCQRYFFRMYGSNTSLMAGMCVNGGNGANRFCFSLPVPMRTLAPPVTYSNLSDFKVSGSDGAGGVVSTTLTRVGNMTGVMYCVEMKATGFTTGQVVIFYSINTTGYIDFTADL